LFSGQFSEKDKAGIS